MSAEKLDRRPTRTDLTDRECAGLISGLIGTLLRMSDLSTVRQAVRWCAETEALWDLMAGIRPAAELGQLAALVRSANLNHPHPRDGGDR